MSEEWPWMIFDLDTGNAIDMAESEEEAEEKIEQIRRFNPDMDPDSVGIIGPPEEE